MRAFWYVDTMPGLVPLFFSLWTVSRWVKVRRSKSPPLRTTYSSHPFLYEPEKKSWNVIMTECRLCSMNLENDSGYKYLLWTKTDCIHVRKFVKTGISCGSHLHPILLHPASFSSFTLLYDFFFFMTFKWDYFLSVNPFSCSVVKWWACLGNFSDGRLEIKTKIAIHCIYHLTILQIVQLNQIMASCD